jgi:hypothetical protein
MREIKLGSRRHRGLVALVDDEDFDFLNKFRWSVYACAGGPYARGRAINGKHTKMHRLIMNTPLGLECDHINHDTLDNRKSNLRNCTRSQNMLNQKKKKGSSRFKGVSWCKKDGRWLARLSIGGDQIHIGSFKYEEEAFEAYKSKAKEAYGEFYCEG